MSVEQTLLEIRQIRSVSNSRHKKKKNQSKKEFLIQKANNTCVYCQNKFKKEELCFVHKNHTLKEGQIFEPQNNRVIACKGCSSKKGNMDHIEFITYIQNEKKEKRKEIVDNYPSFANKVFTKYNRKCIYCEFEHGETPQGIRLTIDHKKPISKLGENDVRNLAPACEPHNKEKNDRTPKEYFNFLESKGRKHTVKKATRLT